LRLDQVRTISAWDGNAPRIPSVRIAPPASGTARSAEPWKIITGIGRAGRQGRYVIAPATGAMAATLSARWQASR
jgi:hypothetical protein